MTSAETTLRGKISGAGRIDFATSPEEYRHWQLDVDGSVARLTMRVQEDAPLHRPTEGGAGYELKLNSYDLGVDIELYDAVQRLRFEHPEVGAVVVTSGHDRVFCAGANIRMLAQADHALKVNFCKFTNETRNGIEDASEHSGQHYICAINGPAAGGGYELALACEHIVLIDDGSSTVALPELPLLAVLPGTGGLTRLVDKRRVRRDHADFLCTASEGVRGSRAVEWRLVGEIAPRARFEDAVAERAAAMASEGERPDAGEGIVLGALTREFIDSGVSYEYVSVDIDRELGASFFDVRGPDGPPPQDAEGMRAEGDRFWPLALARELDDAILHLRTNEGDVGTWVFRTKGNPDSVEAYDQLLLENGEHWLAREITLYLKRTLKRLDVSSRSLVALVEPGSCFAGTLLELALAADRCYMLDGVLEDDQEPAAVRLTGMNFGPLPMVNGWTRAEGRFLNIDELQEHIGRDLDAEAASELGLVTFIPDDIDWEDEVRLALEERASFSPDALTGMEANLRFGGPETLESKIFGRLSAWQNWIFQRPNASGSQGALQAYGTGARAEFDRRRA
ncbi:MAG: 2,3-epoxybenzoyl-CoA dihydrolase [Chloroflexi bacterium]|nr:2,3-epoxybenzoyl-CoA dihydrolase [Chloroflexota bacterium]